MVNGNAHHTIRKLYSGNLGELRNSSFKKTNRNIKVGKKTNLSLKYVVSGEENYTFGDEKISLRAGQALFLKQHKSYHCSINFPIVTKGVCVDLSIDHMQRSTLDPLLDDEMFFFDPNFSTQRVAFMNPQLHNAFRRVAKPNSENDPMYLQEMYLQEMMIDLSLEVLNLEKSFAEKIKSIPAKKSGYKKEIFKRLLIAKNYINDQKFQKLTLKSLARESHISEYYLHRLFSNVFGVTPSEYLEKLRMTEAANLIRGGQTITDVSYKVGYNDVSYFCRRFKKFYGKTPKQYQFLF